MKQSVSRYNKNTDLTSTNGRYPDENKPAGGHVTYHGLFDCSLMTSQYVIQAPDGPSVIFLLHKTTPCERLSLTAIR